MTIAELQTRLAVLEAEISELKERIESTEALAGIRRGLDEANRGLGIPLKKMDEQLRSKHGMGIDIFSGTPEKPAEAMAHIVHGKRRT